MATISHHTSLVWSQSMWKLPPKSPTLTHPLFPPLCSCFGDSSKKRNRLILPSLVSSRVYAIDTGTDPRAPTIHQVIEPSEMKEVTGLAYPHTTHCLGSGEIMISTMGDPQGNAKGMCYAVIDITAPNSASECVRKLIFLTCIFSSYNIKTLKALVRRIPIMSMAMYVGNCAARVDMSKHVICSTANLQPNTLHWSVCTLAGLLKQQVVWSDNPRSRADIYKLNFSLMVAFKFNTPCHSWVK